MTEVLEEFRAAIHSIWHRRWLALGVAWGVCVLGWLVVALIPNTYESRARIFVQLDDVLTQQTGIVTTAEDDILRLRQTLASNVNLKKVVRSTMLGRGITSEGEMNEAIEDLSKSVSVRSEEDNLFELTATIGESHLSEAQNARLSQDVVQKLIDIFRTENIAGNRGEVAETIVFLEQQLDARKADLEAAEQKRLAFESQHPELIGGSAALSGRLGQARTEIRSAEADLAAAQSALAAINGQLSGTPRTLIVPGGGGSATSAALSQAEAQLSSLAARGLTDNHPDMISAQRQVRLLEAQLRREGPQAATGMPNPAYSSLVSIRAERQANVQALRARRAALGSEVAMLASDQASEPAAAAEMTRISRDYEVMRKKYDDLLKDREDLRFRGQVEDARSSFRFDVIDPPTVPRAPTAPNRLLLLLGVLIAGLGIGVLVAAGIARLRSTFSTASKLERVMDLPVLGSISRTMTDAAQRAQRKRTRLFFAGTAGLAGLFAMLLGFEFLQRSMLV